MSNPTDLELTAFLGVPIAAIVDGRPVPASGQLTPEQQHACDWYALNHDQPVTNTMVKGYAQILTDRIVSRESQPALIALRLDYVDRIQQGETLSSGELAEMAQLRALYAQIKAIHRASETIRAMDPLPADLAALVEAFNE